MNTNNIKLFLFCIITSVATGVIVYVLVINQIRKTAVVDAVKLFDGFNMKNELEEMAKNKLRAESKQLDSIGNDLQMARTGNRNEEEQKRIAYDYSLMKTKLDNDYKQSNHDINEQVWKRLNPLLDEYGKKEKLHVIIGANGMGSVLYNDEFFDRTNEVIKYVNKRYAEGN